MDFNQVESSVLLCVINDTLVCGEDQMWRFAVGEQVFQWVEKVTDMEAPPVMVFINALPSLRKLCLSATFSPFTPLSKEMLVGCVRACRSACVS